MSDTLSAAGTDQKGVHSTHTPGAVPAMERPFAYRVPVGRLPLPYHNILPDTLI
jgi:hypothetical protein